MRWFQNIWICIVVALAVVIFILAINVEDFALQWTMLGVGAGLWAMAFGLHSVIRTDDKIKRIESKIDHIISEKRKGE